MTEKEREQVKGIIEVTVKTLIETLKLNLHSENNDKLKKFLDDTAEYEIKCGKDDVDALDPAYWKKIEQPNTLYVEWNHHRPI